jgi:ADP-heptose:LPS heptosyltransferase
MRIDRYVGLPLAYAINVLIRIVGKLLRLDHSLDRSFKTIAVAKYKGLGSIVQATPLLQTLRKQYPEARLLFITTHANKALAERLTMVDEVLVLNDGHFLQAIASVGRLMVQLWKRRIGVFLDLEIYSNASSLITSFSLARNRMGYYLRSSNYRLGMYTHMMFYNIQSPVSEAYLQFARLLGCKDIIKELYPFSSDAPINENVKKPYLLINPNASDLRIERRWSAEQFVQLIDALRVKHPDKQIVLIGSNSEANYVDGLVSRLKNTEGVENLAGKTSLDELIALISHARLMITNDTGPMHLGFAQKIPIVALFGPCSPDQYGQRDNTAVIYKNVYCSPCVHEFKSPPCKGNNLCMQLISVEEVLRAVENRLQLTDIPYSQAEEKVVYRVSNKGGNAYTLGMVYR